MQKNNNNFGKLNQAPRSATVDSPPGRLDRQTIFPARRVAAAKGLLQSLCILPLIMALSSIFATAGLAIAEVPASTRFSPALKHGVHPKLGGELVRLHTSYLGHLARPFKATDRAFKPDVDFLQVSNGYVVIDAVATQDSGNLRAELLALGARNIALHKSIVSARVPIESIARLGELQNLRFARPFMAMTWAGVTTSQGDVAQRSDIARSSFGVNGTGISVGAISDSYNCNATQGGITAIDDIASGDLPTGVNVLVDNCPGSDEGRAMLQIIHDIAPNAALAFHTGVGGQATFANAISALVTAGADVIVDDVFHFAEPMFQDGIIAQAADAAVASGVAYFSSAGNAAAASYESQFRNSGVAGPNTGMLHDFDPGPGVVTEQPITVPVGGKFTIVLQWNQPSFSVSGAPGAATDIDFFLYAADGTTKLNVGGGENFNVGNDPIEAFAFTNTGTLPQGTNTRFFLKIEKFTGPDPDLIKYMYVDGGGGVTVDLFDTQSGASYGHSSAVGAMSVGAAAYSDTPAFGTSPPLLEPYSSRGNVPIYFRADGSPINPPDLRLKPEIVAPDRVNTTFFGNDADGDGFPNFSGTSASAPHAAGIAALLLDFNPTLTPAQIYSALESSTVDMLSAGFDFDSGFGLVRADAAINALSNMPPVLSEIGGKSVAAGSTISVPLIASDPDSVILTLTQTNMPAFCVLSDGGAGSGNINCSPATSDIGRHAIAVIATDGGNPARSDSRGFYLQVTNAGGNLAPVLAAIGGQSVEELQSLLVSLSATDPDGNSLVLTASGLPGFCSLTDNANGTGNITCNPLAGNAGNYTVTVTVMDNGTPSFSDNEAFNIVVTAPVVNQAPVLGLIVNQSVDEGQAINVPVSATDPDGDGLTFSQSGLPAFCSLTDNTNGTGNIACNPVSGNAGSYPITVTVTDNGTPNLGDSQAFTIVVNAVVVNQAPVLGAIGSRFIDEGQTLNVSLSATDPDADGLAFSQSGLPAFCSLSDNGNGSGIITCNPLSGNAGTYMTTVNVTDNGTPNLTDSEIFSIVVNVGSPNQQPVMVNIAKHEMDEGTTLVMPLSASDPDGNMLTYSVVDLPVFCSLADFGDGTGSITCSPGFSDAGQYRPFVTVTDNGSPSLSDGSEFRLQVFDAVSGNQAPVLSAIGAQSVAENASLIISLSASDADGNSLVFGSSGLPAFCSLSDIGNGTGSINCNPVTGDAGTFPVTLTVTDNGTPIANDSETFNIVVTGAGANQAPVLAAIGAQSVAENTSLVIALSATDADGDLLVLSSVGLPAFCSLTDIGDGTGNISCNPVSGDAGTSNVTLTVTDNGTPTLFDSEAFSLVVNGASLNQAPVLKGIGQVSGKDGRTLEIKLEASDNDGDGLVFSTQGMPAFCTLIDSLDGTGIISCDPVLSNVGFYSMTALVTDNGVPNLTASEIFDLEITTRSRTRDMNGDGMSDILWRNSLTGENKVYLMNGATIVVNADINIVSDLNWKIAGNGDYNGDGMTDILWRNTNTGQNWMYLMGGSTILSSVGVNTVPLDWQIVGNGDYDGDGKDDILWRNSVTGQNWLYLMNGGVIMSSIGVNSVPGEWVIAGGGDYNGDGRADILWRNTLTGQNWMYLMNGATIINSAGVNTVAGLEWEVVGDGDYNGDGSADILWRNGITGQNWMYLMNGAAIVSSAGVNSVSDMQWNTVGFGDYDGDGLSDILWRNSTTGQNWLYLMNGATILNSVGVDTVIDPNWKVINAN